MSDTPRTDAHVTRLDKPLAGYVAHPDSVEVVPAEMAREIERELASARRQLKQARELIAEYEEKWVDDHI